MDKSRKANREGNEVTLHYKSKQETRLDEELSEDKLTQLLVHISQLDQRQPEPLTFNIEENSSVSANGSKAKPRASSTLGCVIG